MILDFEHKGLAELWVDGTTRRIGARMHKRIMVRLDRMDIVASLVELDLPGYNFHPLKGFTPTRYSIHVNGP
jgi:toxin HigB-1